MSINVHIILLMLLTMAVLVLYGYRRIRWIRQEHINPQAFATRLKAKNVPPRVQAASDNFQNLFELPVLFYLLCFYKAWGNEVGVVDLWLANVFVASRYAHSFIHCTYNKVTHRFVAYLIGVAALLIMLLITAWGLIA